jgi:hypothetical protein
LAAGACVLCACAHAFGAATIDTATAAAAIAIARERRPVDTFVSRVVLRIGTLLIE